MVDKFTPEKRSEIMSKVRGKNTAFEMTFRRLLWKRGLRYRIHHGPFNIDIAFIGAKVAVFLDSCFWHACSEHGSIPKSNKEFWSRKLKANRDRDREATESLEREGWTVIRLWEHDIRKDIDAAAERIQRTVES